MAETPMRELSAEEVFSEYGTMVYRLLYARTGNKQDAEDLLQEVFLRYLRRAPSFSEEAHRKAWLIRTAINCAKSLHTSPWHTRTAALDEHLAIFPPEKSQVYYSVLALPVKYRMVVHLFYYEEMATKEIAELMGCSDGTVRSLLSRAREKLRKSLEGVEL